LAPSLGNFPCPIEKKRAGLYHLLRFLSSVILAAKKRPPRRLLHEPAISLPILFLFLQKCSFCSQLLKAQEGTNWRCFSSSLSSFSLCRCSNFFSTIVQDSFQVRRGFGAQHVFPSPLKLFLFYLEPGSWNFHPFFLFFLPLLPLSLFLGDGSPKKISNAFPW